MVDVKNAVPGTWYCAEDRGKWYLLRYGHDATWYYNGCTHKTSPRAALRAGAAYGPNRVNRAVAFDSEEDLRETLRMSQGIETLQLPKGR